MGLDGVEYVMAIEEYFEISISDEAAAELRTPRDVVAYLMSAVRVAEDGPCLTQRAFYRLRRAVADELGVPVRTITPGSKLTTVGLDDPGRWTSLRRRLGVGSSPWPCRPSDSWWGRLLGRPATFGDVARHLMEQHPLPPFLATAPRWTPQQVGEAVLALAAEHFRVPRSRVTLDSRFVEDLHVDGAR